jgi:hypothetical protein
MSQPARLMQAAVRMRPLLWANLVEIGFVGGVSPGNCRRTIRHAHQAWRARPD